MRRKMESEPVKKIPDNEEWDRTRAGTQVRIRGEQGRFVVAYEASHVSGRKYVGMWGGLSGHKQFRSPAADRVVWPATKKPRGDQSDDQQ